ncbi:MAG TPA: PASTA domain-containing protein [Bacteroidia bacterium]|jgi:beta-lactam-binding protein with PASTA domain|nr:PASTA domain-containing protein [Bacteroidia bacterium]
MSYFKFIRSKTFVKHFLLASSSALLLLWIGFKLFGMYTQHGVTYTVPDFNGQSIFTLDEFVKDKKVRYLVNDSIYDPKQKPGIILRQDPEKETQVKENRIIYLTVTSVLPPQIEMPKLVDLSLRAAIAKIESYGLKANQPTLVADPCKNCVLKQLFNGKEIAPGTSLKKGSKIDLVVGKGTTNETVTLPDCVGLTFCDAKNKLLAAALQVGNIIIDKTIADTCEAFVYKQTPGAAKDREVSTGARIDLYISDEKPKN